MNDLVKKLREPKAWMAWNDYGLVGPSGRPIPAMEHDADAPRRAADYIEKLEAEVAAFKGETALLADILRDAYQVINTIDGEESEETERLWALCHSIATALAAYDNATITIQLFGKSELVRP